MIKRGRVKYEVKGNPAEENFGKAEHNPFWNTKKEGKNG